MSFSSVAVYGFPKSSDGSMCQSDGDGTCWLFFVQPITRYLPLALVQFTGAVVKVEFSLHSGLVVKDHGVIYAGISLLVEAVYSGK